MFGNIDLFVKDLIACKSAVTRCRWMSDFSDFDEGKAFYPPEVNEKSNIPLSDERLQALPFKKRDLRTFTG